jgi:hypothetical protein
VSERGREVIDRVIEIVAKFEGGHTWNGKGHIGKEVKNRGRGRSE